MPALAFGLGTAKSKPQLGKAGQKRKGVFADDLDNDNDDDNEPEDGFANIKSRNADAKPTKLKLKPILDEDGDGDAEPPRKSPKLSHSNGSPSVSSVQNKPTPSNVNRSTGTSDRYTNLSALRTAKLHDEAASKLDASVYDYDAVYDTFHATANNKKNSDPESSGPKYMTSLMASAETRKRDHLRAREKQVQRERENEGDEFADKEKFVTGAYKKAQEEMRQLEEAEKQKEIEEEERRRKGGGMEAFNRNLLRKEEERQQAMQQAMEEVRQRKERGEDVTPDSEDTNHTTEDTSARGANIIVNDDGEIIDKRQLLGAGLNVAPVKPSTNPSSRNKPSQDHLDDRPRGPSSGSKAYDAKQAQRERQSRMVERQIEEMARKQREDEEAERKEVEDKNKSKITENAKASARERFLARKKEREEEAKRESGG